MKDFVKFVKEEGKGFLACIGFITIGLIAMSLCILVSLLMDTGG
jgi:hypothetical protein